MAVYARRVCFTLLAVLSGSVLRPGVLKAQEAQEAPEATLASVVDVLRRPSTPPVLLRLDTPASSLEEEAIDEAAVTIQATNRGRGKGFMIAGAAALIGGLIIGGDAGTVVAVGGVALGVYGILLYY